MNSRFSKYHRLTERARIVHAVRAFFVQRGYLEVETPQRLPANAPELHIDAQESGAWDLQTSPELAMKRILARGAEKIFQISHCWRKKERGSRHLPEFTMLEWYRCNCDYQSLMTETEELLRTLVPAGGLLYQGQAIDLSSPFERLSVEEAFQSYCSKSVWQALRDDCFDELLVEKIEPHLGQSRPTILYDYPAQLAALSRRKAENSDLAERFELYIAGLELANAFSELTEPQEQRDRFTSEEEFRCQAGKRARPLPEPFLKDMEALPECSGIALGVDRLVMLLTDAATIDEVVWFTPEDL